MAWTDEFESQLLSALRLDLPHEHRPRPGGVIARDSRDAAVLVLFGQHAGELGILLTRRTEHVETHKGQIAFPGGVRDEEDAWPMVEASLDVDAWAFATALRETEEEVGISREKVRVIGKLPELITTTGFRVAPVVGALTVPTEKIEIRPNPDEIDEAFWAPLSLLFAPDTYRREFFPVGAYRYPIDVFQVGPHRVWGATGSMLKNLIDRLRAIRGS